MIDYQIFCGYFADRNIITVLVASEFLRSSPCQPIRMLTITFWVYILKFFSQLIVTMLWATCPSSTRSHCVLCFRHCNWGSQGSEPWILLLGVSCTMAWPAAEAGFACSVEKSTVLRAGTTPYSNEIVATNWFVKRASVLERTSTDKDLGKGYYTKQKYTGLSLHTQFHGEQPLVCLFFFLFSLSLPLSDNYTWRLS